MNPEKRRRREKSKAKENRLERNRPNRGYVRPIKSNLKSKEDIDNFVRVLLRKAGISIKEALKKGYIREVS